MPPFPHLKVLAVALIGAVFFVGTGRLAAGPLITEFLAINDGVRADEDGFVNVVLANEVLGIRLQLRYRQQELLEFTQWKQMGWGIYTLGIEPGNCRPEGRVAAREREALVELAPGEQVNYRVEISVLAG